MILKVSSYYVPLYSVKELYFSEKGLIVHQHDGNCESYILDRSERNYVERQLDSMIK